MTVAPSGEESQLFLLEAWVADNPGSRLFLRLAKAYKQAARLEEAKEVLQRGLAVNPHEVEARELLSQVLTDLGDAPGAQEQLLQAAQDISRHAGVYERLAQLWEEQGLQTQAGAARRLAEDLGRTRATPETQEPASMPGDVELAAVPLPEDGKPPEAAGPSQSTQPSEVLERLEAFKQAALKRGQTP
ncbi:MAG: tetratricopeptide repeat protein [Desulfarculaceae bacterium]|jgi:tetratricopeptide (TPR) repeat protein